MREKLIGLLLVGRVFVIVSRENRLRRARKYW